MNGRRTAKPRLEGAPHSSRETVTLTAIVVGFKARFPDEWESMRLCPLQHGLDAMIGILEGA